MDENQRAAYLISQSTAAMIAAMGYVAENEVCKLRGEFPVRSGSDFEKLIYDHELHSNQAIAFLLGR